MIGIGVIGYGYWGPNLARNFAEAPGSKLVGICDLSEDQLKRAGARYPGIKTTSDPRELINDPNVHALAIATPVSTHFELALQAIKADKHIFVEKPMSSHSEQALRMIDEARKRKLTLMVDHTFVYTGAVRKIHDLIAANELGDVYYYDSVRVNLGLFQHDISVLWDLAVHDLSIMNFVLPQQPVAVSATGVSHVPGAPENVAYLTMFFDSGLIGHVHVNWLAPTKVRQTLIGGSSKMIVYDDLEPSEKVKVYDKGITVNDDPDSRRQILIGYRTGDMWAPQIPMTEALREEAQHFVTCIEKRQRPQTDGQAGLQVVRILEAASESMAQRGRPVELPTDIAGAD